MLSSAPAPTHVTTNGQTSFLYTRLFLSHPPLLIGSLPIILLIFFLSRNYQDQDSQLLILKKSVVLSLQKFNHLFL
ncbi:hypothetical protein L6452_17682 [Arctium lappa]|uniref:Uncharacterized protein n=1 Tax=Arctium lappa TaxID=4217 RepID=A0ACB9C429_ARCLA|nr:hypothetical protein L6452_17682 [Arctium lappa]